MFVLSNQANKDELVGHMHEQCILGKDVVTVGTDTKHSQTGSYAKGFKFHTTTYVVLCRPLRKNSEWNEMSYDYGKTWFTSRVFAMKSAGRNKIMIKRDSHKEFSYDAIQDINRAYGM